MFVAYFDTDCEKSDKAKNYSHWPVTITLETVNLDQSECRKITCRSLTTILNKLFG